LRVEPGSPFTRLEWNLAIHWKHFLDIDSTHPESHTKGPEDECSTLSSLEGKHDMILIRKTDISTDLCQDLCQAYCRSHPPQPECFVSLVLELLLHPAGKTSSWSMRPSRAKIVYQLQTLNDVVEVAVCAINGVSATQWA